VWASHCRNESGELDQYAAAMHHLAADIWPQNTAETRIEWCYVACMNYFFGGGLKRVRDKVARRQNYQYRAAESAEDNFKVVKDNANCSEVQSVNCDESAVAAVESTTFCSAPSSFTM